VEDDHYSLLLRGHLYCNQARSLDPQENLRLLLVELHEKGSLATALSRVAGGMFALFALDHRRGIVEATVDRLGCMPVYYQVRNDQISLSNNQFTFQGLSPLSETAVCEYLKYGHLPFSESLFETVRRIQPGQTLRIWLNPAMRLEVISRLYRGYLPPAERIQDLNEGAKEFAKAFDVYFSRLGSGRGLMGLSGGYDSRLMAAFAAALDISFVNFGNPDSREVRFAKRVAERTGRQIESFRIPDEAVSLHGDRFKEQMLNLDSFENAHVFEAVDRIIRAQPAYYVDGFIGDTVVGSGFYYKLGKSVGGLVANLLLRQRFESPPLAPQEYAALLYNNKRAVPDEKLNGLVGKDVREALLAKAGRLVEDHLPWCPTHEDLVESLSHATRVRCLTAGGPVAIGAYSMCACPFIDHKVFNVAMDTAKHLRAGDRLYNALWRLRFPHLIDIPRANTGGRPRDSDRVYRLKHLVSWVLLWAIYPRLKQVTLGRWDRTERYSTVEGYVANAANIRYLRDVASRGASRLPTPVMNALFANYAPMKLDPSVLLRMGTLMVYLA